MPNGTNAARMRAENEKAILSLIQRTPLSRAQIAKRLGLTRAALTFLADGLIQRGWVKEAPSDTHGVGRTPLLLSVRGEALHAIGVNVTRKGIFLGIWNFNGALLGEDAVPFCSPDACWTALEERLPRLMADCRLTSAQIYGLGIVTPGPIDAVAQRLRRPPNFPGWEEVNVVAALKQHFPFEVSFTDVSKGTALAEKYFGAAKNYDSFIALLVNHDGVGSAIFADGRLSAKNHELGHTAIVYQGLPCACGNCGCLERYAALSRILEGSPYHRWRDAVDSEDPALLTREADYLSAALLNATNAFDIDRIVLCGDICYNGTQIAQRISQRIAKHSLCQNEVTVTAGTPFSPSLPAAAAVIHRFFT